MVPANSKTDRRFGPKRRVKRRRDFLRIQNDGRKYRSKFFLLTFLPGQVAREGSGANPPEARLGVTVTTKVHKRAVKRNKIKRAVREYFRGIRSRIAQPNDIVVIALNGSTDLTPNEIGDEIDGLFRRAKLIS